MMKRKSFGKSVAGFTLVELLVVIGIIAILTAVSFAAITSGLASAKKAKCMANLRSIGVGLTSFAGENNGQYPEAGGTIPYNTIDATTGQYSWTQQIESYMGGPNSTVYQCPDSKNIIRDDRNYGYFLGAHAAYHENGGSFGAVTSLKMRTPAQHILAGDIAFSTFGGIDCDKDDYNQDPAFNGGVGVIPIHRGTVNILFADGHVENVSKFDQTSMTTIYEGPGHPYLY